MSDERQFPKLTIRDGAIEFFLYMQDGTRMPWRIEDTHPNRMFVDWLQVHDSPLTGSEQTRADRAALEKDDKSVT